MTTYVAPIKDIRFVMNELADMPGISQLEGYGEATPELVDAVLDEAGRLASEVLAPLNVVGDQQGARLEGGKVVVPEGFTEAYHQFVESGWMGISQSPEYGGQGLPHLLDYAICEFWNASNMAFALNPLLTSGAIEALSAHGSEDLKAQCLPKMVSGEWSGTMNLTEPQAGSDLAAVRTKAEPEGDHYRVTGQKIFITWGDHEMAQNVIHLVLARLPDAPDGVKGISLFMVPKYLINADGSLGDRNDVRAVSLEHKLGVHASPTCVMSFGDNEGAIGYLVGEENNGLAHMFTMMNHARLGVGIQGPAIAERAYQQAAAFARDRVQGAVPGVEGRATIINHPDVRRMLMLMRAQTEAMRALTLVTAAAMDRARHSDSEEQRQHYQRRLDLLVPVAKGWSTELAQEVVSLGVQVHGGMGFVEETGAAQHLRDARIITIYEGTTGIQANDLVGRKILRDGGAAIQSLLEEITAFEQQLSDDDASMQVIAEQLSSGRQALEQASRWLLENGQSSPSAAGAVAVNLMLLMGTVLGGYMMARAAQAAAKQLQQNQGDADFYRAKIIMAQFYAEHMMPRSGAYLTSILAGENSLMALDVEQI